MASDGASNSTRVKVLACGAGALALLVGAAAFTLSNTRQSTPAGPARAPTPVHAVAEPPPSPSLYCLFSDFTHKSVVVGFDFVVTVAKGAPPRFAERSEAVRDDPAVDFAADNRPAWSFAADEDGTPTIASPDGATRIVLYGFKPDQGDSSWFEAGIRSNAFRNLDGKCFQAHFYDAAPERAATSSPR